MEKAICKTLRAITGSSLTSIRGFLTIGTTQSTGSADLGIVMNKGRGGGCNEHHRHRALESFYCWIRGWIKYGRGTIIQKLIRVIHVVSILQMPVVVALVMMRIPFGRAESKTEI